MGSTGDPPVPVGDPPTGTSKAEPSRRLSLFAAEAHPIPSGESPDGTGQWPVLPKTQFPNTLSGRGRTVAPARAKPIASSQRTAGCQARGGAKDLPLPEGEGWGEGNSASISTHVQKQQYARR